MMTDRRWINACALFLTAGTVVCASQIDAHARDYVYGLGSSPLVEVTDDGVTQINIRLPGRLVAVAAQTGGRYLLQDHLGSTTVFTGSGTAPDTVFDYTPYGDVTAYPSVTDHTLPGINYLFQGHEYEPELSLYNFKARLYSPSAALFLSTDPAGTSISPYTPFGRNPIGFVDLNGEVKLLAASLLRGSTNITFGLTKYQVRPGEWIHPLEFQREIQGCCFNNWTDWGTGTGMFQNPDLSQNTNFRVVPPEIDNKQREGGFEEMIEDIFDNIYTEHMQAYGRAVEKEKYFSNPDTYKNSMDGLRKPVRKSKFILTGIDKEPAAKMIKKGQIQVASGKGITDYELAAILTDPGKYLVTDFLDMPGGKEDMLKIESDGGRPSVMIFENPQIRLEKIDNPVEFFEKTMGLNIRDHWKSQSFPLPEPIVE